MELFSEVNNRYFGLIYKVINECSEGKKPEDIIRIINDYEYDEKLVDKNQHSFEDIMLNRCDEHENLNLLRSEEDVLYPSIGKVPARFTKAEKAWLKAMLDKKEVHMVLSQSAIDKLQRSLEGEECPCKDEYVELTNFRRFPAVENEEAYIGNFKTILKAIMNDKAIRYTNEDRNGNVYRNVTAIPLHIEYSMRDGRFRLSLYSVDERRPVMANLFSMTDITILDEDIGIKRKEAKELLIQQKFSEEPIILEVTDKKAAMERCFMCFSGMERTARDLGDNRYEIQLSYYLFEEENIVNSIISLGPYVKVLSPQHIIDRIVKRIKKSIELSEE